MSQYEVAVLRPSDGPEPPFGIPTMPEEDWSDYTDPEAELVLGLREVQDIRDLAGKESVAVEELHSSRWLRNRVSPKRDFEFSLDEIVVPMEVCGVPMLGWEWEDDYLPPIVLTIRPGSYGTITKFDCVYLETEFLEETGCFWHKFWVTRDSRRENFDPADSKNLVYLRIYTDVPRVKFPELDGLEYIELLAEHGEWEAFQISRNEKPTDRFYPRMDLYPADAWSGAPFFVIVDIEGDRITMRAEEESDYNVQYIETWRPSSRKDVPI